MNYNLVLRPELLDDVHGAFIWYEGAATGLGHEFLRSYFVALAVLQRQPLSYRKVYQDFRRILLVFGHLLAFDFQHSLCATLEERLISRRSQR